jgi:hypothetical protein
MSKAELSIDGASAQYQSLLAGRWAGLPEVERAELRSTGLRARGPALVLLADEAWHRGDIAAAKKLRGEAAACGYAAFLRPRSLLHFLKTASGPAAPTVRRFWDRGVIAYRDRRYRARYREAGREGRERIV